MLINIISFLPILIIPYQIYLTCYFPNWFGSLNTYITKMSLVGLIIKHKIFYKNSVDNLSVIFKDYT